jgi:hypothetical protein
VILKTVLFCLAQIAVGHAATASPPPSYESAKTIFETGRLPLVQELMGQWDMVGNVTMTKKLSELAGSWPDGRIPVPEYGSGFFRLIRAYSENAGQPSVTSFENLLGAETGKLYEVTSAVTWIPMATGFVRRTDSECVTDQECRMIAADNLLLCQETSIDDKCGAQYNQKVVAYSSFVKRTSNISMATHMPEANEPVVIRASTHYGQCSRTEMQVGCQTVYHRRVVGYYYMCHCP